MNNGFVKVAAATPKIKVGDCGYNGAQICKIIDEVYDNGAQLVVFPELCITVYTCSDLFCQKSMLDMAKTHLQFIAEHCEDKEIVEIAELFTIAYLYEHREEADHKNLTETVKYLLFPIRKEVF